MSPLDDDAERDAWLSAALRHAPDAQAAAPPEIRDTILRQARAAAREANAPDASRPRGAWAAAWDWLARPPVAAGFASVMVATLVGLIWWDRPMDETLARPPASEASQAPRAAPPVTTAPPVAASSEAVATRAPASERAAAPKSEAPRAARAESRPPAPAVAEAARPAPATPAAPATPTPLADSRAPAQAAQIGAAGRAVAEAGDESSAASASGALSRHAAKAVPFAAAPTEAARLRREDRAEPRPAALAALLDGVAAQPERWSWQRGEARQPMNPALQGWLLQLDRASAGRWNDAAAAPAGASALHLYRDGTPVATLRLGDDAVWLAPASQAGLPRAAITALKQALADATR